MSADPAQFVHLHVHSEFSMLDGAIRIPDLVDHVRKMEMPAVALTDNGNMFGAVQLVNACKKAKVKPILGCEVNVLRDLAGKVVRIQGSDTHVVLDVEADQVDARRAAERLFRIDSAIGL